MASAAERALLAHVVKPTFGVGPTVLVLLTDAYDETGNIGKRYRRQDEIGTPACVTVDYDSLKDGAGTVRDRDTMVQARIAIVEIPAFLRERIV